MSEQNWIKEIDLVTDKFKTAFGSLTRDQLNYKPKQKTWSIAQNIEHLILLNNSYFKYFLQIQQGKHDLFQHSDLKKIAQDSLSSIQPYSSSGRLIKANTWDIWQPRTIIFNQGILKTFERHQIDFKTHIDGFKGYPVQDQFIKYPGHADLVFQLNDCIDFLIEHENRHWEQAHEIAIFLSSKNRS